MNIRCAFCQTPYTLSRNEILFALQKIDSEKLNHYDAHCPRCRRATQLPTQRLEIAFPNWRQAAEELAAMPPAPANVQSTPEPVKVEPAPKAAPQIATPVAKKVEAKKTAPTKTKSAMLKKTATPKTAAKAKPVAKKSAKSKRK